MLQITIVVVFVVVAITFAGVSSAASWPTARIVGGTEAIAVDLPWIVSLLSYGSHACGGSIINKRTILTAAHCLVFTNTRLLKVHVGSKTRSLKEGDIIPVEDIRYHKLFNMTNMDYDIGLVRLAEDLQFSPTVQPIALPKYRENVNSGTKAIVSGWGFQSVWGMGAKYLRYAIVPIVQQQKCKGLFDELITDRMICAGYLAGGIDACVLDSGGPLVAGGKLVGIVSWGIGCAQPNKPGVYTRVSELMPWVDKYLASYNE